MERPILPAMDMDYLYHAGNARMVKLSWYANQSEVNRAKVLRIDKLDIDGNMVFDVAFKLATNTSVVTFHNEAEFDQAIVGLNKLSNYAECFGLVLGWDRDGYYSSSFGIKVSERSVDVVTVEFNNTRYRPGILVRRSNVNSYHEAFDYTDTARLDRIMSYQDLDFTVESYNDQSYSYVKGIPEAYFKHRNSSTAFDLL